MKHRNAKKNFKKDRSIKDILKQLPKETFKNLKEINPSLVQLTKDVKQIENSKNKKSKSFLKSIKKTSTNVSKQSAKKSKSLFETNQVKTPKTSPIFSETNNSTTKITKSSNSLKKTLKINPAITKAKNLSSQQQTTTACNKQKMYNWKKVRSKKNKNNNTKIKREEIWFDDVSEDLLDLENNNNKDISNNNNTSNINIKSNNINITEKNSLKTSSMGLKKNKNKFKNTTMPLITQTTCTNTSNIKDYSNNKVTKVLGLDCEMVGVGEEGRESMLARVSMVNCRGDPVLDMFVKPSEKVTDYRTRYSGIRPHHLVNGASLKEAQEKVHHLLKNRILVGHALHHDLKVLYLDHPRKNTRDTSIYFRKGFKPSLKGLAKDILGVEIQEGEHDSIQDAKTAMNLYMLHRKDWEKSIMMKRKRVGGVVGGVKQQTEWVNGPGVSEG